MRDDRDRLNIALHLLAKVLPHLDLRVSEHNDGYRLQRDILMFLAGAGYPGYYLARENKELASETEPTRLRRPYERPDENEVRRAQRAQGLSETGYQFASEPE